MLKLVRLRQRRVGQAVRVLVEVVAQAVEHLHRRRDLPVVLHERAEDAGVHVEAQVAGDLRHRRVAERVGAGLRREVRRRSIGNV